MNSMVWSKRSPLLRKWLFPEVLPSLPLPALPVQKALPSSSVPALLPKVTSERRKKRERIMRITVDYDEITHLRRVVMQSCGYCVDFMRLSPLEHASRMQLCLCVEAEAVPILMDAVMWELPQAEFGLQYEQHYPAQ